MLDKKSLEGVEDYILAADGGYVNYLKDDNIEEVLNVMADYKDYSPRNAMLIHLQDENAGRVFSVPAWKEKGRKVKIGSEPITIFEKIYDSFTNKGEHRPEGGNLHFTDGGIYRQINVYREKDTFGFGEVKSYNMKDIENHYEAVKDSFSRIFEEYNVFYVDELSRDVHGTALVDRINKEIEIKKGLDKEQEFKTLVGVGTLVFLKQIQTKKISMLKKYKPNVVSTFIKECVEYMVDRRFKIDVPNIKRVEERERTVNYQREEYMTLIIARQIANKITGRVYKAIDYSISCRKRAEEEKLRREERDAKRKKFFEAGSDQKEEKVVDSKSQCFDKVPIDDIKTIDSDENEAKNDKIEEKEKE